MVERLYSKIKATTEQGGRIFGGLRGLSNNEDRNYILEGLCSRQIRNYIIKKYILELSSGGGGGKWKDRQEDKSEHKWEHR